MMKVCVRMGGGVSALYGFAERTTNAGCLE